MQHLLLTKDNIIIVCFHLTHVVLLIISLCGLIMLNRYTLILPLNIINSKTLKIPIYHTFIQLTKNSTHTQKKSINI